MLALTSIQIVLLAALGVSWIVTTFRVARMAKAYGRRPVVWFFITFFFSAIPATIVFWIDSMRNVSATDSLPSRRRMASRKRRCPQCGEIYLADETDQCPNCKMPSDSEDMA
ncbi:MAG: hypothetical protein K8S55_13165 [Phycisphaerae bacterium]|nr:hypothetical protein [Phycisphaerae bacterium]